MSNSFEREVQVDCILSELHKHRGHGQISHKIKEFQKYLRQASTSSLTAMLCIQNLSNLFHCRNFLLL